ncbi:MAG TPA: winged helix-turn-helix domain-containing protein [Usitatibacter sp.]|jgi:DNA-binding winged helix-turn-helix (wHTH) protein/tetratricopeptide (TPR) repeat protein|nr:winged helix-turn-helix domain-containing protein [Usitatibacter sp.]
MSTEEAGIEYEFGPFRLDAPRRALYRGTEFVPLTPKAAEMLLLLVEQAGRVVTKEQIFQRAWAGVVVEEGTIANNISALRKVLDPAFGGLGPIATVARRGYRFAAAVRTGNGIDINASAADVRAHAVAPGNGAAPPQATPDNPPVRAITERDSVLMGDIENKTGDAVFDGTLRQALLLHLAQSPFLQILADRKVKATLQLMQRPTDTPVTGEVALEICQRTGAKAAITGSIFALADEYSVGIVALDRDTGDIIASEQARARGKGEVLKALDAAATNLRANLGESLVSVKRLSAALEDLATPSLEALKAYTVGRREWNERGDAAGIPHQLRALELDPHFASAHSAVGIAFSNLGQTQRANEHIRKAYDLRNRASERERSRIEAIYHLNISGNVHQALDVFNTMIKAYPRDSYIPGNIGNIQMQLGQWEKALESTTAALASEPTNVSHSNLAIIHMALGRREDARRTIDAAFARGLDAYYLRLDAYQEAFLRRDDEAMRRHFDAVAGRPSEEDFLLAAQADTESYFGRHHRAREFSARAAESAMRAGAVETSAIWLAQWAMREAELKFDERAFEQAEAALERSEGRIVRCVAAYALARAGDRSLVGTIASKLDADFPEDTLVQRHWLPCIRAAIAIADEDAVTALRALEPAQSMELALVMPFEGGFMLPTHLRGLAHLAAGKREEAAREFASIEARPGLVKNYVTYPLAVKARENLA